MRYSIGWMMAVLVAGSSPLHACTLGNEVYEESGPGWARTVTLAVEVLTGKTWNDLPKSKQEELITKTMRWGDATHVVTDDGELAEVESLVRQREIPAGRYRVSSVEDEGDFLRLTIAGKEYWIEERYGCYGTYSYDILIWSGYSGELCDEDDIDGVTGDC